MLISVIIPVYNADKYLKTCLDSIIKSKNEYEIEVLLINDGSVDGSLVICKEYARKYFFISVFSQVNKGPSSARNKGIKFATGEFLVFIDADDFIEPDYLLELYNSIKKNDTDLACCGYIDHSVYGIFQTTNYNNELLFEDSNQFVSCVLDKVGGVLWDKIFKREIIVNHKITFNNEIRLSEDLLFVLDYLKHIKKISIVTKHLYHYNRLNQEGLSKNYTLEQFDAVLKINEKIMVSMLSFNREIRLNMFFLNKRRYSFVINFCNLVLANNTGNHKQRSLLQQIRSHDGYDLSFNKKYSRWIDFPIVVLLNFKMYSLLLHYSAFLNGIRLIVKKNRINL